MRSFKIAAISLITMITTTAFATGEKQPPQPSNPSTGQVQTTAPKPAENTFKPITSQVQTQNSSTIKEPVEFQKVVDEYKSYVAKIPAEVREEIITYRKEIAKINKEKRLLYRQLSQEAQNYLKTEQDYKKRLPLNRKSLINVEAIGEKNNKK